MFRYPDKPGGELERAALDRLPQQYLCTLKMDGWRCVVEVQRDGVTFTSRQNKPLPVTEGLRRVVEPPLMRLPVGTTLDAEWLARRPAARLEALWFFDLLRLDHETCYPMGARDRFTALHDALRRVDMGGMIVPHTLTGYGMFYDGFRHRADAEGVVLKRSNSPYVGSVRASAKNLAWFKCKWRAGESGQTERD